MDFAFSDEQLAVATGRLSPLQLGHAHHTSA